MYTKGYQTLLSSLVKLSNLQDITVYSYTHNRSYEIHCDIFKPLPLKPGLYDITTSCIIL